MIAKIRSYLRNRLPVSLGAFKRNVGDMTAAIMASRDATEKSMARLHGQTKLSLERLDGSYKECASRLEKLESGRQEERRAIEGSVVRQGRSVDEMLWADVFNSTISSSEWLHDTSFSPGRWAVGYPYLYVLYRVLNEVRPQRILELGLGQSTRMIAQYAAAHETAQHLVVEHDEQWIDFFSRNYRLPDRSRVVRLDWGFVPYKEAQEVRVYEGFAQAVQGERFDLISIDGPLGGDMSHYARIDVLGVLPDCLASSFVIMIDDYEREAESRTMREMQNALSEAGVDHRSGRYSGSKDLGLLCSPDLGFLCSM